MKKIVSILILSFNMSICLAGPIGDLAGRAVHGRHPILSGVPVMEVVVISECENENIALNPTTTYQDVDISMTRKVAYVQELDGSRGMRLIFDSGAYNDLHRYDIITLDVNGGRLRVSDKTGARWTDLMWLKALVQSLLQDLLLLLSFPEEQAWNRMLW